MTTTFATVNTAGASGQFGPSLGSGSIRWRLEDRIQRLRVTNEPVHYPVLMDRLPDYRLG